MNTYIISDIHGHNETFRRLLKRVSLKKNDKLILLGDLIDRGPYSKEVLDTVILLKESGFDVTCLMGNHEAMMLDAFENFNNKTLWLINGGNRTLESFLTSDLKIIPAKYRELISAFQKYLVIDKFIFVHAGLNMKASDPFSDFHSMIWLRNRDETFDGGWLKNRIVIHGHSPKTREEIIESIESRSPLIGIDNGCYLNSAGMSGLGALHLEKMEFIIEPRNESFRSKIPY